MYYCTNHLIQRHKGGAAMEWSFHSNHPIYTQLIVQLTLAILSG